MFRRMIAEIAILVAILATGAGVAISERAKDGKNDVANMGGTWVFDVSLSDPPPAAGSGGGWGRGGSRPRGEWKGRGKTEGTEGADGAQTGRRGGRGRMARLPDWIKIVPEIDGMSIVDSIGAPVEQIKIGTSVREPSGDAPEAVPVLSGKWKSGHIEIVRSGRRGKMTQEFALEENGRLLVIRTKMDSQGERPSMEFKRVYRRSST